MSYTVGFIGLGHMGFPMAKNLLDSKIVNELYVFDLVQDPIDKLVKSGAKSTQDLKSMAEKCNVIFTMLQTGEQVSKTCLGSNGIFANSKPNLLYIDCSSIDVTTSRELHKQAREHNISMLDAPVSGGVKGAEQATLTIMVGGSDDDFTKAKQILDILGKNVIHAGADGNGQVAKICNNMILGVSMIAVSEAFNLGEKLGLQPKNFFDIVSKGSGECWSLTKYCPSPNILPDVPSSNDYKAGFTANMMLKDLNLSQQASTENKVSTPMGANAKAIYEQFVQGDNGEVDFSGVIKFLNELNH